MKSPHKNNGLRRYKLCVFLFSSFALYGCHRQEVSISSTEENCTCTFQEYQTQLDEHLRQHANDIDVGDGCYKPVIYYNEHLYWLSTEDEERKIPNDFIQIGTAQCIVIDGLTLPQKQLESNLIWGSKIYSNGKEKKLYANTEDYISVYINEDILQHE